MRIRNLVGENGRTILEYIPETDEDRDEIARMMLDRKIPDVPAQAVPIRSEKEEDEE